MVTHYENIHKDTKIVIKHILSFKVMAKDSEEVTQHLQIVFNLTGQFRKLYVPQHLN